MPCFDRNFDWRPSRPARVQDASAASAPIINDSNPPPNYVSAAPQTPARLTIRRNLMLAAFSVLYTLNIAVSNPSLQLVTVPFRQVVRTSAPFFTILVVYLLSASRGKGRGRRSCCVWSLLSREWASPSPLGVSS